MRRLLRRTRRRALAQLPFLAVLAVLAAAAIYLGVSPGHWRRASGLIAFGMLLAGGLRLVLRAPQAGMLKIRARWIDVGLLLGTRCRNSRSRHPAGMTALGAR